MAMIMNLLCIVTHVRVLEKGKPTTEIIMDTIDINL